MVEDLIAIVPTELSDLVTGTIWIATLVIALMNVVKDWVVSWFGNLDENKVKVIKGILCFVLSLGLVIGISGFSIWTVIAGLVVGIEATGFYRLVSKATE